MEYHYDKLRQGAGESASLVLPLFQASNGTWFDEAIDFRDPEGDKLTREVLALIAAIESRKRKRRLGDEVNHYTIVRKILANGFRCHFHRHPHLVAYSRKADGYEGSPAWLSGRAMAKAVDLMASARLLDARLGKWGETSSIYHIKPKLYGIAQDCGVTSHSLTLRLPPERLVRLREGNSDTPLMNFTSTGAIERWTALLAAYNDFVAGQDISLSLTDQEEAEWVKHLNSERSQRHKAWRKSYPRLCRPELFKTDLYRTFNNGSFEQGGRLYGGWWTNVPKHLRPKITIKGQPTVELDYSGCAIRMLYHERGIDYPADPYLLESLSAHAVEAGSKADHYREGIKAMVQALINGDSNGSPEMIRLNGFTFKPFTRPEVRCMIEEKHTPIADTFGTGAGLRLQRKDSDLALSIITELREQGVAALPIHDSFITAIKNKDKLIESMNGVYRDMFGFYPIIK